MLKVNCVVKGQFKSMVKKFGSDKMMCNIQISVITGLFQRDCTVHICRFIQKMAVPILH